MTFFVKYLIAVFCIYVYIFPFRAFGFDPRMLVFILYLLLFYSNTNFTKIRIYKGYIKSLLLPISVGVFSLFTLFVNSTSDLSFVIYPLQIAYLLVLSYAVFSIIRYLFQKVDFQLISVLFILTLLVAGLISILMFAIPSFNDFMFNLQGIDTDSVVIKMYLGKRLIGLGCFYFGGGLIFGLGLILVMSLYILTRKQSVKLLLIIIYVLLFIMGNLIARTCLVGAAVSWLILFFNLFKRRIKKTVFDSFVFLVSFLTIISLSLVTIYMLSPQLQEEYGMIVDFGFEAFINYAEEGTLETASSEGLKTHYRWPESIKTYLIGDGRFIGDDGEGYYMGTDVGYIRLIYSFGVFGLLLVILQNAYVFKCLKSYWPSKEIQCLSIALFIYVLLLNLKGYIDLTPYLFLYLHSHFYNLSQRNETENNRILC